MFTVSGENEDLEGSGVVVGEGAWGGGAGVGSEEDDAKSNVSNFLDHGPQMTPIMTDSRGNDE